MAAYDTIDHNDVKLRRNRPATSVPREFSRNDLFDRIVFTAAQLCHVPIAIVCHVDEDRDWIRAQVGLAERDIRLLHPFCRDAATGADSELTVIEDAALDLRLSSHALVAGPTHLRFFAGAWLRGADGTPYATLAVLDRQPRHLTAPQAAGLRSLARETADLVTG